MPLQQFPSSNEDAPSVLKRIRNRTPLAVEDTIQFGFKELDDILQNSLELKRKNDRLLIHPNSSLLRIEVVLYR